jgi:hypothetical protein
MFAFNGDGAAANNCLELLQEFLRDATVCGKNRGARITGKYKDVVIDVIFRGNFSGKIEKFRGSAANAIDEHGCNIIVCDIGVVKF